MTLAVDVAIEVFRTEGGELANIAVLRFVLSCTKVLPRVEVSVFDRLAATEDVANVARPRLVNILIILLAGLACFFAVNGLLNVALLHS